MVKVNKIEIGVFTKYNPLGLLYLYSSLSRYAQEEEKPIRYLQ